MKSDDADTYIENQEFEEPLIIQGGLPKEPERYIAEKPYDLTKYEFSVLRCKDFTELLFLTIFGATIGLILSVAGKTINSLVNEQTPKLETWELWSIGTGILLSILFKVFIKSKNDKEKEHLLSAIDGHFAKNKLRKIHLTMGDKKQ